MLRFQKVRPGVSLCLSNVLRLEWVDERERERKEAEPGNEHWIARCRGVIKLPQTGAEPFTLLDGWQPSSQLPSSKTWSCTSATTRNKGRTETCRVGSNCTYVERIFSCRMKLSRR